LRYRADDPRGGGLIERLREVFPRGGFNDALVQAVLLGAPLVLKQHQAALAQVYETAVQPAPARANSATPPRLVDVAHKGAPTSTGDVTPPVAQLHEARSTDRERGDDGAAVSEDFSPGVRRLLDHY
jgi:hypothetical protein